MNYKEMIELALERGHSSAQVMEGSVDQVSDMLCRLKCHDKHAYWRFMRQQHAIMYDCHYSPEFAEHDVAHLHSADEKGTIHKGAYWTVQQTSDAASCMTMPNGTNECDIYVAFNAAWHDLHRKFSDEQIICIAYLFFFCDEDWKGKNKIWDYMSLNALS